MNKLQELKAKLASQIAEKTKSMAESASINLDTLQQGIHDNVVFKNISHVSDAKLSSGAKMNYLVAIEAVQIDEKGTATKQVNHTVWGFQTKDYNKKLVALKSITETESFFAHLFSVTNNVDIDVIKAEIETAKEAFFSENTFKPEIDALSEEFLLEKILGENPYKYVTNAKGEFVIDPNTGDYQMVIDEAGNPVLDVEGAYAKMAELPEEKQIEMFSLCETSAYNTMFNDNAELLEEFTSMFRNLIFKFTAKMEKDKPFRVKVIQNAKGYSGLPKYPAFVESMEIPLANTALEFRKYEESEYKKYLDSKETAATPANTETSPETGELKEQFNSF